MIIDKNTFTQEALSFVESGKAYDRAFIVADVASSLANKLYQELGTTKAMSLQDVDHLKLAFRTAAASLIDWGRCNRKVQPQDYADSIGYNAWPTPIMAEGEL